MAQREKPVKIKDIAERAEVSASTVSAILNNSHSNIRISSRTKERVLKIAEEMRYSPNFFARSLRTRKSYMVSVVVWDITDPFYGEILKGIERVLKTEGYQLLLTSADGDPSNRCYGRLKDLPVEGALIIGGPEHGIVAEGAEEQPIPHVYIGLRGNGDVSCAVTVDNYGGGVTGTRHLLGLGRRRLCYVTKSRRTHDEEDRLRGFLDTVGTEAEAGVAWQVVETDEDIEGGYNSVVSLVRHGPEPVSIFAADDLLALGIMRALQDNRLEIPADAAVLGFDNLHISAYSAPRLSTLNQPRLQMGTAGAETLLRRITGQEITKRRLVLEPTLILRESC
jgi:DNA-binding LacI/PurR family transcriptional regulator